VRMHIWKHFKTITRHRWLVRKGCFKIGLYWQGLVHDLSKYSPTEFFEGCRYYQGTRSPNNKAREVTGISNAWLHHKGRNKHHYEYWIDYDKKSPHILAGYDMPKKYIAEMVVDRVSACKVYEGESFTPQSPLNYYMKSRKIMWFVSDNTKRDLEMFMKMYAEKGEDETFAYIKNVYLRKK